MDEGRARPGWIFWCVVLLFVPLLFSLMAGPACWLSSRFGGAKLVSTTYYPLVWAVKKTNSATLTNAFSWYSELGAASGWHWLKRTWRERRPDGEVECSDFVWVCPP
jgi:hypothetical protein